MSPSWRLSLLIVVVCVVAARRAVRATTVCWATVGRLGFYSHVIETTVTNETDAGVVEDTTAYRYASALTTNKKSLWSRVCCAYSNYLLAMIVALAIVGVTNQVIAWTRSVPLDGSSPVAGFSWRSASSQKT